MTSRTKTILLFGVVVAAGLFFASYQLSYKSLVVTYKSLQSVQIFKTSAVNAGKAKKPVATITHSGQSVRLREGDYTLYYTGGKDYESKYVSIAVSSKGQRLNIDPSYSEAKLSELLVSELPSIRQVLAKSYPNVDKLYQIQPGKLYQNGAWYGTTLFYKGADRYNNDTLRVVLHKIGGSWHVATQPPDVTLSKFIYPDVPRDILSNVNSMPGAITGNYSL